MKKFKIEIFVIGLMMFELGMISAKLIESFKHKTEIIYTDNHTLRNGDRLIVYDSSCNEIKLTLEQDKYTIQYEEGYLIVRSATEIIYKELINYDNPSPLAKAILNSKY